MSAMQRQHAIGSSVGHWPQRNGYTVYDEGGDWVARGLTAKQAYALANCAAATGQARVVETPDGVRRFVEAAPIDEQYVQYLRGERPDPRD